MKLGIIIPDRGDRPEFMENCLRMIKHQNGIGSSIEICHANFQAKDNMVDITARYRYGYDYFRGKGFNLLAFIENDDWYSPDYLETMIDAWKRYKEPELFGTCTTICYHLQLKSYFTMEHHTRASAMNTFIKPDLEFPWPVDMEPFLDMHLWEMQRNPIKSRIVFRPEKIISVSMKHGVGKTVDGIGTHVIDDRVRRRYVNKDVSDDYPNGFLKTVLDPESFEFYDNYFTP